MLILNSSKNILEGDLKLSDGETPHIVKWLSGAPQASFFIGDDTFTQDEIKAFINGNHLCAIELNSYQKYLTEIERIIKKYSSMYYGPVETIDSVIARFGSMSPTDAKIVLSYTSRDRYIRILNHKTDFKLNEPLYGAEILKNGTAFRNSFVGAITKITIIKEANNYKISVSLIENWREIIMQANGKKVSLDAIVKIFTDEMNCNIQNGKTQSESAQIFGIKYEPLLTANNHKFSYSDVVCNSQYNSEENINAVKNGMILSPSVIWETKDNQASNASVHEDDSIFNHNLWGIHIKNKNDALSDDNPHICIGWSKLGDLETVTTMEALEKLYDETWPDAKKKSKKINIGQLWRFIHEAQVGDYVILGTGSVCHIGKIVSDHYVDRDNLNQDPDYIHNRKVEWLLKNISRDTLSKNFHNSIGGAMSFFGLNDYKSALVDLLNGTYTKDEDATEEVIEGSCELQQEYEFDSTINNGQNIVVYGTPGCGKSFYVQNTLLNNLEVPKGNEYRIRTTFFADYTNTDFVGQVLPKVNSDGSVTYEFNPGPFTLALKKAIECPEEPVALIIEELNRGNAASIFGDIFQLLDRTEDGSSRYEITNVNIQDYFTNKCFDNKYVFNSIKIPGNLFIVATMNTSDQNVFTLDTAFKRRWQFEKIRNIFADDHKYKDYFVPGMNHITWKKLVEDINDAIVTKSSTITSEDKQIGVYFITEDLLCKNEIDVTEIKKKNFAYKLFEYLWDDVAKFAHQEWFIQEIKTLDQLIEKYKTDGEKVFVNGIIKQQDN